MPRQSFTILVVDDDPESRLLTTMLLRAHGQRPFEVDGGDAAIASVRRQTFDLILMDLEMPHMNGMEATTLIREITEVPIFALTSVAESEAGEPCRQAGMNGFISKPLDGESLLGLVAYLHQTAIREPERVLVCPYKGQDSGWGFPEFSI